MSTTITRDLADTYFKDRLDKKVWEGFDEQDRDRGIQSALDVMTRLNGYDITTATVCTSDSYYPNRAVYHQALHMLMHGNQIANAESSAPKWAGVSQTGDAQVEVPKAVSQEALKWLNLQSGATARIGRG